MYTPSFFRILDSANSSDDLKLREAFYISKNKPDFKVPLRSNCRYPFFLHFRARWVFPRDLAKFQSVANIGTRVFWTFISENLRPPLIFLVPVLVEKWSK